MKKLFLLCLLAALWGACNDVENEGIPEPLQLRIESTDYYVQITQENREELAFVFRWTNVDAEKYTISITSEGVEQIINIPDRSILTYNEVRELSFSNQEMIDYLNTFGLLNPGTAPLMTLTLNAFSADGTPLNSDPEKNSKTATIHVVLAANINLTNY